MEARLYLAGPFPPQMYPYLLGWWGGGGPTTPSESQVAHC